MIQIGSEHVFEMGGEKAPPSRLVDMKKDGKGVLFRGGFCFLFVVSKRVAKDGMFSEVWKDEDRLSL